MLLASCAFLTSDENWRLVERGYDIQMTPDGASFAVRVHLNELKQVGGTVHDPRFRLYVRERLRRNGLCLEGWEPLECVENESCVVWTPDSVKVYGRCLGRHPERVAPQ